MNDAEREKLYQRWQEKRFDGKAFCNAETIKNVEKYQMSILSISWSIRIIA